MASLRKLPDSRNWIACFSDATGRRRQRSTGTNNRQKALSIAVEYEAAARQMKTEAQIRRVMSDLYERVSGSPLPSGSINTFLEGWLRRKDVENAERTAGKYRETISSFLAHLAERSALDLSYLVPADILSFRDKLLARVSATTANHSVKVLRIALNQAKREGLIQVNPAAQVANINRRGDGAKRRAFTLHELRDILHEANEEWRGMIAFGVYTGQRLGDLARLTWANVHLEERELRLVTRKTGRRMAIQMASPLIEYLSQRPSADTPGTPLFPAAYNVVQRSGRSGALSNQFYEILVAAGLAPERSHQKKADGSGRAAKRQVSEISFHSLRHTATSLLKNAGVSQAVAMEFIGHESEAMSQHYTHIESRTLREAAEKLPNIFPA